MDITKQNNNRYQNLIAYRKAIVIYDLTYHFCERFIAIGDRTKDQMIQAARSGKQNIVEGKAASLTSAETHLKLLGVARASFQELLEDYLDYLRTRKLRLWETNSKEVNTMRELGLSHDESKFFLELAEKRGDEVIANMAIVLLHQEDVLLRKHIEKQIARFVVDGGFRESLTKARIDKKKKTK
ncbi:MAG: four helix bundle suffix domain-containing protein [Alistipes sp.]|nr:four helix bundle suffix domain-containing protein [Alistipes sp.]